MVRLALIADDLTGAADSGVQFAKRGISAILLVDAEAGGNTACRVEALIVNTDSRADPHAIARAKLLAIASSLPSVEFIYKKIDSTLRGNVGVELDAIMEARHIERAIVAPAFPPTGRTTVHGQQFLDGQRLEDTSFAVDPLFPITNSHIPTMLSRQMHRKVGLIELSIVRGGADILSEAMTTQEEAVLVVDATSEEDLRTIARAATQANASRLTCGSAGLADAVAEVMLGSHIALAPTVAALSAPRAEDGLRAPVLVVAASRNPLTSLQVSHAAEDLRTAHLPVDSQDLAKGATREIERLVAEASEQLRTGHSVIVSAADSPHIAGLGRGLVEALGQVVRQLADQHRLAGLVATGGDAALAVCHALDTTALLLVGEVAPGIPLARIHDGPRAGLRMVTKAGGFGQEEAISTAIRHLQRMVRTESQTVGPPSQSAYGPQ